ncbi:MAG TPA: OmpA family protein [Streptosporangiaceae bacterium]|nr:OmpA family protein [Streptosporangiaceae bacterium]
MRRLRVVAPASFAAGAAALALVLPGCRLLPEARGPAARQLGLATGAPSVLAVLVDEDSPAALTMTRELVLATARNAEHILVIGDHGGELLASSTAPNPPSIRVPGPPPALPPDPTSFQKSHYTRALRQYRAMLRDARARLGSRRRQQLAAWARSLLAQLSARIHQVGSAAGRGAAGLAGALGAAAADISSLRQAGLSDTAGQAVVIIGGNGVSGLAAPVLPQALRGSSVVVAGFPGSSDDEAAWQAALMQDGAARAVLLVPAASGQLGTVVRQGLDGAFADTLTSVLFALGQSRLRAAALPQLGRLLQLLTVTYPQATASIDGYTDDLPTPGGNRQLSQRRAAAVQAWLVAHGVAPSRLQAAGYGDADPIAPNTPAGQPLNRRVVVIINPGG